MREASSQTLMHGMKRDRQYDGPGDDVQERAKELPAEVEHNTGCCEQGRPLEEAVRLFHSGFDRLLTLVMPDSWRADYDMRTHPDYRTI